VTVSKRNKTTSALGSFHGSDIAQIYGGEELTDYLVHFVNHLDPNGPLITGETFEWPPYTISSPQLLTLLDTPSPAMELTMDTFRTDGINFITELKQAEPPN
jgi:acetylcholinesterase